MISLLRWPLRNAWFFRTLHLPVLLGTALAAAVLTGSLVVGDSLRGSLKARAERQLNGIESAYLGAQLIEAERAAGLPGQAVPALILQGSIQLDDPKLEPTAVPRATIVGINPAGREFLRLYTTGTEPPVLLGARTAKALNAKAGSKLTLGLERRSSIPRSSVLGRKSLDDVTATKTVTVTVVLPEDHPSNDFQLVPNPTAPLLLYLPLEILQNAVDKPGRINAILAKGSSTTELNAAFTKSLTLADWGLRVSVPGGNRGYVSVESEQLLLNPMSVTAAANAAATLGAAHEPTIVYLANVLSLGIEPIRTADASDGKKLLAYSVVAGVNPAAAAPLGPFLPTGITAMADDEIVLTDWADSPLKNLPLGSSITITYFRPDAADAGEKETHATLRLKAYAAMAGPAGDANLTPPFPGITDKLSIGDWDEPFEMNKKRITRADDKYWEQHKATPKAYLTRAKAEQLFGSRLGSVTSVRVAVPAGTTPAAFAQVLQGDLLKSLDPSAAGLQFQPIREQLLTAGNGGTDFGLLFLLFSGLLILSAMLLTGLLFRLMIERRAKEIGVLSAVGWERTVVRRMLSREGSLIALLGTVIGVPLGILYANQMLGVLTSLWPDAEVKNYLGLHVSPYSPLIGAELTLLTAWLTIRLSLRGLLTIPTPQLLRGRSDVSEGEPDIAPRRQWVPLVLVALAAVTLAVGPTRTNPDERAGAFFTGGLLLLAAGLRFLNQRLRMPSQTMLQPGPLGIFRLGLRNAARRRLRTVLMVALAALSVFLVVSVESFRRRTDDTFLEKSGGSGGLRLVAEADVPLFHTPDSPEGKADLEQRLELDIQNQVKRDPNGPTKQARLDAAIADLDGLNAFPFRLRRGDDASCLNLYQAAKPRVLGVPQAIVDRGGFRFTQTLAETPEERANPWLLLVKPGEAIPVFAEQNTAYFMLKTLLGGIVDVPDENGAMVKLKIVGLLQDSVFQSELLMADGNFRTLFPRQDGFNLFLLDVPAEKEDAVVRRLNAGLRANGVTVQKSSAITGKYLAVVGAYLTVFQLLGGLGLLLAVLGISVVILRNIRERSGELALLRAIGWNGRALQMLVLGETLFLLVVGVGLGVVAALAAVLPNLAFGGTIPWANAGLLIVATLGVGLAVAAVAVVAVTRQAVIPALRQE